MTNAIVTGVSNSKTKKRKVESDDEDFKLSETNTTKKSTKKSKGKSSAPLNAFIIFVLGTLASVLVARLVPLKNVAPMAKTLPETNQATKSDVTNSSYHGEAAAAISRPTYTMYALKEKGASKPAKNLSVIRKILKVLGYTEVDLDADWNLLWGFGTPFPAEKARIMKLRPHQMVNHMPGMQFLVSKVILSTSGNPFMPPAFKLPEEKEKFLEYAAKNSNKTFVEKGNGHRNVAIKKVHEINLNSTTTFVQQFITNPYLVDGFKFDIGVYTVVTSIDPLRVYIYTGDAMFRYCQKPFHPFDPNVLEKYVVGDDYRPTWKVPSLKKYFSRFGGGMRASFDAYVRDQAEDPAHIWAQAEEVIRATILAQAKNIAAKWATYPRQNFFELIRVDMIVDTDFKVHLIEINLSPNMYSKKFKHNHVVFQQVIYNALQLVGVGTPVKQADIVGNYSQRITALTADKSVASNLNECAANDCDRECDEEGCDLCLTCLDDEQYEILAKAHREHTHRADMRRIFPKAIDDVENFALETETQGLSDNNKWMVRWFYHKCRYDPSWCQ